MLRILQQSLAFIFLSFAIPAFAEVKKATFAGGCFWCMEPPYDKLEGVISTVSGYAGGELKNPTYEQVSSGRTGHQEVVQVTYDDEKVSYQDLLDVFWVNVDPLDDQGQFCDEGSQYLSGIFYQDEEQKRLAEASKEKVETGFDQSVKTFVKPLNAFYPAEEYHQNYYDKNPLRYNFYRSGCGRDARLKAVWGDRAGKSL
ncbi:peptide-methionine (S)-S-oxide reductase MsrA [Proteobacteria bacterium 005FR1]|nr:peptide-methionine (S)-S-oxide reductase MsrA [Proteobacteria bacterium 005FR1]